MNKIKIAFLPFAALLSLTAALPAQAETLIIPVGKQASERADIKRPATGTTRAQVRQSFGEPLQTSAPKGTPPISSWEYQDFVVYFEHDHVIHSVLKHRPYVD